MFGSPGREERHSCPALLGSTLQRMLRIRVSRRKPCLCVEVDDGLPRKLSCAREMFAWLTLKNIRRLYRVATRLFTSVQITHPPSGFSPQTDVSSRDKANWCGRFFSYILIYSRDVEVHFLSFCRSTLGKSLCSSSVYINCCVI